MLEFFSNKIKICSRISLKFIYSIIYSILYFMFYLDSHVLFYISSILVSLPVIHYTSNIVYTFLCLTVGMYHFPFLPKKIPSVTSGIWEGDLLIVVEPPKFQYEISKTLFSYVRRFPYLHDYNSKSLKFKKLTKIGLLQIVFPIFFIFPIFFPQKIVTNAQNYSCSK